MVSFTIPFWTLRLMGGEIPEQGIVQCSAFDGGGGGRGVRDGVGGVLFALC